MLDYALIVTVIIGITELIKQAIPDKFSSLKKFIPIVSLALGVVSGIVYVDEVLRTQVFIGLAMGLAASGLFDIASIPKKK